MYKFQYDYEKPKYSEETKLYHIDTDIKTHDIYKDAAEEIAYIETIFDTLKYDQTGCF